MNAYMTISRVALYTLIVCTGACGSSPQERFFTLASDPPAAASSSANAYLVVIGPVAVPELVDRPQLVLRTAPSRVEIAEQARWAAPLKSEIPRVVADHLARLLEGSRTAVFGERTSGAADYRVVIDVQRFESAPQQGATLQASWTLRAQDGTPILGRTLVTEPAGSGYEELVAAHSRALATLSREIATAIQASRATKR
jgi:uncharacterized lipoprotein YmbA